MQTMDQYHVYVLVLQIVGIISFSTTSIAFINSVFLFLLQRANQGVNSLFSISLAVTFICFGDSIANGVYLTQYRPASGTLDCSVSGYLHMIGYMITWMFTFYVAFVMYSTAVWETMPKHVSQHICLCLGIPILFVSIQAGYGFESYNKTTYEVCLYTTKNEGQEILHWITFWGLLGSICVMMCIMRGHQFYLEIKEDQRCNSKLFMTSKTMLQYYPILLIVCWIPTAIEIYSNTPQWFNLLAISLKISHGFFVGLVYFSVGDQAKKYFWIALNPVSWYRLLSSDPDEISLLGFERGTSMELTLSMFKGSSSSFSGSHNIQ
jgi:hypothetical protein